MGQESLKSPHGFMLEQALTLTFPLTNNQIEYEACLLGLEIATDMKVQVLIVFNVSKLMVNQLNGEYQVKETILQRVDLLSKLSNIEEHEGMENIVRQTIHVSRFVMMIERQESWTELILEYIHNGVKPKDQRERRKLQRQIAKFCIIDTIFTTKDSHSYS